MKIGLKKPPESVFFTPYEELYRYYVALVFSEFQSVGSSRVDLQACKLEYSIVSPK